MFHGLAFRARSVRMSSLDMDVASCFRQCFMGIRVAMFVLFKDFWIFIRYFLRQKNAS